MGKPFGLWRRKTTGIFYYRLASGGYRSTGFTTMKAAMDYALERLGEKREEAKRKSALTLAEFAAKFYTWDECPHVTRLRSEGKQISQQSAAHSRAIVVKYILPDPLAKQPLSTIRRGHLLDFREQLRAKLSARQVNRVMGVLKTILKEAVFREELYRDPSAGIGNLAVETKQRGIFTPDELAALFPQTGLGPWPDIVSYTCFLLAATSGARRGEVLALTWANVDFEQKLIRIEQAWKDDTMLGKPKWNKVRITPLPDFTLAKLKELRAHSLFVLPSALVFCEEDGSRKSFRWWQEQFYSGMKNAKIDYTGRSLSGHSFRHSLCTSLRDQGYDAGKMRASLGWSSEKVQDGYTHFGAEHLRAQADIVGKLFLGGKQ